MLARKSFKRSLLVLGFILFIFLFRFQRVANGVEGALPNQSIICLEAKFATGGGVKLTSKEAYQFNPPGTDVYVIDCVSIPGGEQVCTTGVDQADTYLFGTDNGISGKLDGIGYKIDPKPTQPVKSDNEGKIGPIIWKSWSRARVNHAFFGVTILPDQVNAPAGQSLQLGTWFPANATSDCASLAWDPYGRVFDSQSLEPIPDVKVWLQTKETPQSAPTPVIFPLVINPQNTGKDGIFQFPVPDGTYYLEPVLTNHTFPLSENLEGLHPNYNLAYFDIYTGDPIVQKGKMEHRDIPVTPKGTPYRAEAVIIDRLVILNKLVSRYQISGTVSHPLSKVEVYNGPKKLTEVKSSKFGNFEISLDSTAVDPAQDLTLKVIKTDLTGQGATTLKPPTSLVEKLLKGIFGRWVLPVNAQANVVKIPVILNYIEGYAYGSSGKPEPGATVEIYLTFSKRPFHMTQSDEKGYFKVPSQYLPSLPYNIKVTAANGAVTTLNPTQFSLLNKKFVADNHVNYGNFKPDPEITLMPSVTPAGGTRPGVPGVPGDRVSGQPGTREPTIVPPGGPRSNKTFALIFLILVLLVLTGLSLYLYRKKKSEKEILNQNPPGANLDG